MKKHKPKKIPTVDVSLLLDRTGSMQSAWGETLSAINTYCRQMTEDREIRARIQLTTFHKIGRDAELAVIRPWSVGAWKDISPEECPADGMTPLYEAIGVTLTQLRADQERIEKKDNHRTLFVIMTDGYENASSFLWPHIKTKALVDECNALPGWAIVFLGANIAEAVGTQIGTQHVNSMSYDKRNTRATYAGLAQNTASFAASGQASSMAWTPEQRAAAAQKPKDKTT